MPPTIYLPIQNAKVEKGHNSNKSRPKIAKIEPDHLHIGSKLHVNFISLTHVVP